MLRSSIVEWIIFVIVTVQWCLPWWRRRRPPRCVQGGPGISGRLTRWWWWNSSRGGGWQGWRLSRFRRTTRRLDRVLVGHHALFKARVALVGSQCILELVSGCDVSVIVPIILSHFAFNFLSSLPGCGNAASTTVSRRTPAHLGRWRWWWSTALRRGHWRVRRDRRWRTACPLLSRRSRCRRSGVVRWLLSGNKVIWKSRGRHSGRGGSWLINGRISWMDGKLIVRFVAGGWPRWRSRTTCGQLSVESFVSTTATRNLRPGIGGGEVGCSTGTAGGTGRDSRGGGAGADKMSD